jgi:hypothetical protein
VWTIERYIERAGSLEARELIAHGEHGDGRDVWLDVLVWDALIDVCCSHTAWALAHYVGFWILNRAEFRGECAAQNIVLEDLCGGEEREGIPSRVEWVNIQWCGWIIERDEE